MPLYEYVCQQCQFRFEKLTRRTGSTPPSCPRCKNSDTQRILSTFAVHGKPRIDGEQVRAEKAQAERLASITPKSQIDKWESKK